MRAGFNAKSNSAMPIHSACPTNLLDLAHARQAQDIPVRRKAFRVYLLEEMSGAPYGFFGTCLGACTYLCAGPVGGG